MGAYKKSFNFDYDFYIQRNKEVAMEKYGHKLDENRNIRGTNYYFDSMWRLCKREEESK